jgi:hypothetical protein
MLLPRRSARAPIPSVDHPPANVLSSERWTANVFTRGGSTNLGPLPIVAVAGERVRGATPSRASVTVPGAISKDCQALLVAVARHPWAFELHLYRGTTRKWLGPIRQVSGPEGDGDVTLSASDLSGWMDRRRIHRTLWFGGDDAETYVGLMVDAFSSDDSPNARIVWAPIGQTAERIYYADQVGKMAAAALDDLAKSGVTSTTIERTIYVGDAVPLPTRKIRLVDSHFSVRPAVTVDGDQQVNDLVVAGGNSSDTHDPVYVRVTDEASMIIDGALEDVLREAALVTDEQAAARGAARLRVAANPPVQFSGGKLDSNAPILFDELVPGATYDVSLANTVAPVAGAYELVRVAWSASATEKEAVSIEVQPAVAA